LKNGYDMRRSLVFGTILVMAFMVSAAWAQTAVRLSIVTGGTGGVYYPMGAGMANVLSKYIPYAEATAEVTTASVDNCLLVGAGKANLALIMADVGWDAYQGKGKFNKKEPLRTIAVLYPNNMHIVTLEGQGIQKVSDLKGKRVSTGAPGSGTQVKALRVLEAYGLDPDKDMKRDRLGASESAGALKDRKKVEARLDLDHLERLRQATNVPLVLHGGSGVKQEYLLAAIKKGIAKVNVGTEIRQAYESALSESSAVAAAQDAVYERTSWLIRDYFGLAGTRTLITR